MIQISKPTPVATGRFNQKPLAHILVYILGKRLGGSLEVDQNGCSATVYFQEGRPAKIRTDYPGHEVGSILVELGYATNEQIEAALNRSSSTSALIGEILTAERTVEPRHVVQALKIQMMRKLASLFSMTGGEFAFYEGVNLLRAVSTDELFPVDTYSVILAGLREHGSKLDLTASLGALQNCFLTVPDISSLKRLRPIDDERVVCTRLTGEPKPFEAFWNDEHLDRAAVVRTLYVLLITKELKAEQQPPEMRQSQAPASVAASYLDSTIPGDSGTEVSAEVIALREKIQKKAADMASLDYFGVLEIERGATSEQARKAYFRLAKEYHPDKLSGTVGREYVDTLHYVFSNISEAYVTLTDPAARDEYVAALEGGREQGDAEERAEVLAALQAENAFQKAIVLVRREHFAEALGFVEAALDAQPDSGDYLGTHAYVAWKTDPEQMTANMAIDRLRRALENCPKSIRLRLFLGSILQHADRRNEAREHYQLVLRSRPNNVEAARALRYMDVLEKREQDSGSKGLMGIIFGKKS